MFIREEANKLRAGAYTDLIALDFCLQRGEVDTIIFTLRCDDLLIRKALPADCFLVMQQIDLCPPQYHSAE